MGDGNAVPKLVQIAKDHSQLRNVQNVAAAKLRAATREVYPHNGCAITLSVLLQSAGVDVPDIFQAFQLGNFLMSARKWKMIAVGEQRTGDVGSTCGMHPRHGHDHIYLVLQPLTSDQMLIADNQVKSPHIRHASGYGKTPTTFFIRAD